MYSYCRNEFDRLRSWRAAAVHRRIATNVVLIGALVATTKLVALFKDQLVAGRVGPGEELDAFLLALMIPTYAIGVIAASLAPSFVPGFIRVRERDGAAAARRHLARVVGMMTLLFVGATMIMAIAAPVLVPLIGRGLAPERLSLVRQLFYELVALLLFSGVTSVYSAVLNAEERFVFPTATPGLAPLATIAVLWPLHDRLGVHALVIGALGGAALEMIVILTAAWRRGLLVAPTWGGWDSETRAVAANYVPFALGAALMTCSPVIDQSMASSLGPGSLSALNFSCKIISLALGVMGPSLSTILFPHFARLIAIDDWAGLKRTLKWTTTAVLAICIPLTLGLILGSESLVRLLFERGQFTAADTRLVGQIQAWAALQIPFFMLGSIAAKVVQALGRGRTILSLGCINLAVNILGNIVFSRYFGVAGIAASTSLMYFIACAAYWTVVYVALRERDTSLGVRPLGAPASPTVHDTLANRAA